MPDNLFARIKSSVIEGAATAAAKIEEGTRIGKIKLDIAAEENRLDNKYCRLGELAYFAAQDQGMETLKGNAQAVELLGAISENHVRIKDLKEKLKALTSDSGCCDTK